MVVATLVVSIFLLTIFAPIYISAKLFLSIEKGVIIINLGLYVYQNIIKIKLDIKHNKIYLNNCCIGNVLSIKNQKSKYKFRPYLAILSAISLKKFYFFANYNSRGSLAEIILFQMPIIMINDLIKNTRKGDYGIKTYTNADNKTGAYVNVKIGFNIMIILLFFMVTALSARRKNEYN